MRTNLLGSVTAPCTTVLLSGDYAANFMQVPTCDFPLGVGSYEPRFLEGLPLRPILPTQDKGVFHD
jgi:hypothetical protein